MSAEIVPDYDLKNLIEKEKAVLVYFSSQNCSVCKVLKPKVEELIKTRFEKIRFVYVDLNLNPEFSSQYQVFTAPSILLFFENREQIRKSRVISLSEFEKEIDRIYTLFFLE